MLTFLIFSFLYALGVDSTSQRVGVLYVLTGFFMLLMVGSDLPYVYNYIHLRGAARIEKACSSLMFLSFISLCVCKYVYYANYNNAIYNNDDPVVLFPRINNLGIEISLCICVISSWLNMYTSSLLLFDIFI